MTYRHDHAVVLLVSPTAAQEPDREDDHPHDDEDDRSSVDLPIEEHEVVAELCLDQRSGDDQNNACQLDTQITSMSANLTRN